MPLGTSGSTLVAELNRLANGGSYPALQTYVDDALAANIWAGTSGLDVVGALNVKAGNTQPNLKDLMGVCNQLAGTTGLAAAAALRQVAS